MMILVCTAQISSNCRKTMSKHGTSAIVKEHVCPFCSAAMNMNPKLREQYNTSILRGTGNGDTNERKTVRK